MGSSSHGADPGSVPRLHFKARSAGHALLIETNEARKTGEPWTLTLSESSHDHYELGHRIVLRIEEGTNATALADAQGLKVSRTVGPNLFILEARDSKTAIQVAEALAEAPG